MRKIICILPFLLVATSAFAQYEFLDPDELPRLVISSSFNLSTINQPAIANDLSSSPGAVTVTTASIRNNDNGNLALDNSNILWGGMIGYNVDANLLIGLEGSYHWRYLQFNINDEHVATHTSGMFTWYDYEYDRITLASEELQVTALARYHFLFLFYVEAGLGLSIPLASSYVLEQPDMNYNEPGYTNAQALGGYTPFSAIRPTGTLGGGISLRLPDWGGLYVGYRLDCEYLPSKDGNNVISYTDSSGRFCSIDFGNFILNNGIRIELFLAF